MTTVQERYQQYRAYMREIAHLQAGQNLLEWDQEVMMSKGSADMRAEVQATLAGIIHEKFVADAFGELLRALANDANLGGLDQKSAIEVRRTLDNYLRRKSVPKKLVEERAAANSRGQMAWEEARAKNDFALFAPYLETNVRLAKEIARYIDPEEHPYDVHLYDYERELSLVALQPMLDELKAFLVPFVQKICASSVQPKQGAEQIITPIHIQKKLCYFVAEKLGFDFERGRLDCSAHPFSTTIHPHDYRMTTKYDEHDMVKNAFLSTVHEVGHSLYELGLPVDWCDTPLGEAASYGVHESQSRLFETLVGHGKPFWQFFYPYLAERNSRSSERFDDFFFALNAVRPSFIRIEADEVTYNLHIILRTELEVALFENKLAVFDLPDAWNEKMRVYFGIVPKNDSEGVLQDVHWSAGMFGYFPTYALGNIYAAQLYTAAKQSIPNMEDQFAQGDFSSLLKWLREHVHRHGRRYVPTELIARASGKSASPANFITYITEKYSALYAL